MKPESPFCYRDIAVPVHEGCPTVVTTPSQYQEVFIPAANALRNAVTLYPSISQERLGRIMSGKETPTKGVRVRIDAANPAALTQFQNFVRTGREEYLKKQKPTR